MNPKQFRTLREKLNMTQSQLATQLQVARSSVARWESGALPIDERTRLALEHLRHLQAEAEICAGCGEPMSEHELRCND